MVKEKLDGFYVYSLLKLTQEMTDVGEIKIPPEKGGTTLNALRSPAPIIAHSHSHSHSHRHQTLDKLCQVFNP